MWLCSLPSITHVLNECPFQYVIGLFCGIFSFASFHDSLELEPHRVYRLRRENYLVAIQFAASEVLVEKRAFVALSVAIPGDESCHPAFVFDGNLHKFSLFQK